MQSAYLTDILKDPIFRRFFESQQPQVVQDLPAEPGVVQTHPALPAEPDASIIQEMPGPVPDFSKATQVAGPRDMSRDDPALRGTDLNAARRPAAGPPPAPETVPARGPVADASAPAEPPEPIPSRAEVDPRLLAMMQYEDPGPQVTGMPKIVDSPDGNILLTGQNPANRGPAPGPKKQSYWSKLKAALPDITTAMIAAGATPSRYGGGPLDIFQGMQAGQRAVEARHQDIEDRDRQRAKDDLATAKVQADIEQSRAAARHSDASADLAKAQINAKAAKTDREQLFDKMMSYPVGSPEYKHYNKLWLESFSGKQPEEDKFADYSPGTKVNIRTGQKVEFDPVAARLYRTEIVRRNNGNKAYYSPQMVYDAASPEQQMFIREGKEPMEKPPKDLSNPSVVLLNPKDYTPEQVRKAQEMFNMMHRPPEPREPSQAALDHAETRRVTDQAGRIWAGTIKWLKDNGRPTDNETVRGLAIQNASNPQYFPDEPNVGGVIAMINKIARTDALTHKTNTPTGDQAVIQQVFGTGGGTGSPAQAAQPSGGRGGRGHGDVTKMDSGAKGYEAYRQKVFGSQ